MSRELLKQALELLHDYWADESADPCTSVYKTIKKIEAELAKPDEPVVWINKDDMEFLNAHHCNYKTVLLFASQVGHQIPLYTTPPDQSVKIAELERVNTNFIKANNALRKECETLEKELQQHRECNDKLEFRLLRANENMESLEQQLAALQANRNNCTLVPTDQLKEMQRKLKPLSSELLTELAQQANKEIDPYYEFARAIERAHDIGDLP